MTHTTRQGGQAIGTRNHIDPHTHTHSHRYTGMLQEPGRGAPHEEEDSRRLQPRTLEPELPRTWSLSASDDAAVESQL